MKILIATPCYGGTLTTKYFASALETCQFFQSREIDYGFLTLSTESLIPRGRNRCVSYALNNGFTHLLFIDADMVWTTDHIKNLIDAKKQVIGGTYPIKAWPVCLNLNALPDKGLEVFNSKRGIDNFTELKNKYADKDGVLEVKNVPTGFLLIDCAVLEQLKEKVNKYTTFDAATGTRAEHYDFFPIGVMPNGEYLSEDWAFCEILRANDISVHLHTDCVLGHTGVHHYFANQILGG